MTDDSYKYKSFSGTDIVANCHIPVPGSTDGKKSIHTLGSLQTLTYSIHMDRKPIRAIGNINSKGYVMGPRTIAGTLVFAVFNKHFAYEVMENIKKDLNPRFAFLADELPPFDITLSFANEYGASSKMVLYGVQLVNEGQVISVNDVFTENTYQYVAQDIEYLNDANGYSTDTTITIVNTNTEEAEDEITNEYLQRIFEGQVKFNNAPIIEKALLDITTTPAKSKDKKGHAQIELKPAQESGTIKLYDSNNKSIIELNVGDYNKKPINVALTSGRYVAQYFSNDSKTNSLPKSFAVEIQSAISVTSLSAPIIESRTSTSIDVYCNNAHVKVICVEDKQINPFVYIGEISRKKASIKGLTPGTTYIITTSNYDETEKSQSVKVSTLAAQDEEYISLKQFVYDNKNVINHGTVEDYYSVINSAQALGMNITNHIPTTLDTLVLYKQQVETLINSAKVENFPTRSAYDDFVNSRNKYRQVSFETILMAIQFSNINSSSNTYSVPAVPEMIDLINSKMFLDDNTYKLEIFEWNRYYGEIDVTKIPKNIDGKRIYTMRGKPGEKYTIQAIGFNGHKSTKLEIYILTDAEKALALENEKANLTRTKDMINYVKQTLQEKFLSYDTPYSLQDRLAISESKQGNKLILPAPILDYSDGRNINLIAQYKTILGNSPIEFYMCISEMEKALYEQPIFKIKINSNTEIVAFDNIRHGIKPNNHYIAWIENSNGEQVSKSTTIYTAVDLTEDIAETEEQVLLFNSGLAMDKIVRELKNNITFTYEIVNIIESVKNDSSIAPRNLYNELTKTLLNYQPSIPNSAQILKAIWQAHSSIEHYVDTNLLYEEVIFNKKNATLTLPKSYEDTTWTIININKLVDNFEHIKIDVSANNNYVLDLNNINKNSYMIIYANTSDIYTKSGSIFVDLLRREVDGYRIEIGGE